MTWATRATDNLQRRSLSIQIFALDAVSSICRTCSTAIWVEFRLACKWPARDDLIALGFQQELASFCDKLSSSELTTFVRKLISSPSSVAHWRPPLAVVIEPSLCQPSPENGNIHESGRRLLAVWPPKTTKWECSDGSRLHGTPLLAGLSRSRREVCLKA